MPELPEVETMVRGIRPAVEGHRIVTLRECPNDCRPIHIRPDFRTLRRKIVGRLIERVNCRGKRVVLNFDDESHLVIEPRMTGLVLLTDPPDVNHLRLQWELELNGDTNSFWFWDRRGLGTVQWYAPGQFAAELVSRKLGIDALEMTLDRWCEKCGGTDRAIKVVLLDQAVAAGIGNLYASEILHRATIHPERRASSLNRQELQRLHESVQYILLRAIEYEGSTLGDGTYRNALNQSGRYQNEHQVYMRADLPCAVCKSGVIQRIIQAQRSTFFCPDCQRVPKKRRKTGTNRRVPRTI